jgi:hypothetical protein
MEPGAEGKDKNLNQGGEGVMKLSEKILKVLGLKAFKDDEVSTEELETAVNDTLAAKDREIESLKADAEVGKTHLQEIRERASTLYKALKGDDAKENYIDNIIMKADLETASSLVEEYQGSVEDSIPLTCPKCGEKLSRQSSQSAGSETGKDGKKRVADYKF